LEAREEVAVRLAAFNVENLFARAMVLDTTQVPSAKRREILGAHARVSELLESPSYAGREDDILDELETLGLLRSDDGPFARLRKLRGRLLRRPRSGPVVVVAQGRADWVGWVELKLVAVNERATENTARVLAELDAHVMTVVEADDRPGLQMFNETMLPAVGCTPYEQVMVIEGNDARGIDVGLMARASYRLVQMRTHVFDADDQGTIFSRDCCEYHLDTPLGTRLVVLANHLKSKGYGSPGDATGAKRRTRQAARVAQIYRSLLAEGVQHVAVAGDLNDDPSSVALAALLSTPGLTDVSEPRAFDWNPRRGTYGSGNEQDKIDYLLMSEPLFAHVTGGGLFRKGVWHGNRTGDPWELFPTLASEVEEASDHAAIYADLTDF
jgi:endonuclease/exonuclease/phosphatase family metal-dependent hydrolase